MLVQPRQEMQTLRGVGKKVGGPLLHIYQLHLGGKAILEAVLG